MSFSGFLTKALDVTKGLFNKRGREADDEEARQPDARVRLDEQGTASPVRRHGCGRDGRMGPALANEGRRVLPGSFVEENEEVAISETVSNRPKRTPRSQRRSGRSREPVVRHSLVSEASVNSAEIYASQSSLDLPQRSPSPQTSRHHSDISESSATSPNASLVEEVQEIRTRASKKTKLATPNRAAKIYPGTQVRIVPNRSIFGPIKTPKTTISEADRAEDQRLARLASEAERNDLQWRARQAAMVQRLRQCSRNETPSGAKTSEKATGKEVIKYHSADTPKPSENLNFVVIREIPELTVAPQPSIDVDASVARAVERLADSIDRRINRGINTIQNGPIAEINEHLLSLAKSMKASNKPDRQLHEEVQMLTKTMRSFSENQEKVAERLASLAEEQKKIAEIAEARAKEARVVAQAQAPPPPQMETHTQVPVRVPVPMQPAIQDQQNTSTNTNSFANQASPFGYNSNTLGNHSNVFGNATNSSDHDATSTNPFHKQDLSVPVIKPAWTFQQTTPQQSLSKPPPKPFAQQRYPSGMSICQDSTPEPENMDIEPTFTFPSNTPTPFNTATENPFNTSPNDEPPMEGITHPSLDLELDQIINSRRSNSTRPGPFVEEDRELDAVEEEEEEEEEEEYVPPETVFGFEGFSNQKPAQGKKDVSNVLCKFFLRTGHCKWGDKCWFSHSVGKNSAGSSAVFTAAPVAITVPTGPATAGGNWNGGRQQGGGNNAGGHHNGRHNNNQRNNTTHNAGGHHHGGNNNNRHNNITHYAGRQHQSEHNNNRHNNISHNANGQHNGGHGNNKRNNTRHNAGEQHNGRQQGGRRDNGNAVQQQSNIGSFGATPQDVLQLLNTMAQTQRYIF